jgi:SAM-dependent methyltransferase
MTEFVATLNPEKYLRILDIGAMDMGGSYRKLFDKPLWIYEGLDTSVGKNVDIVTKDMYHYPIADEVYDVVVSGQVLEHVEDIYAWADEATRILKLGGIMCIIAPCAWCEHKFPVDCWRFYPDGMRFLFVKRTKKLKEINIFWKGQDCVAILKKEVSI